MSKKELRTKCCNAHETLWSDFGMGDLRVCSKCEKPYPEMVEQEHHDADCGMPRQSGGRYPLCEPCLAIEEERATGGE